MKMLKCKRTLFLHINKTLYQKDNKCTLSYALLHARQVINSFRRRKLFLGIELSGQTLRNTKNC